SKLSGGEKQRVLIARAMIQKPKLLLLDEPTKGLDSNGQDQLLALIETIKKRDNTAVMIVDHNINQIIKSCQNILCLNRHSHWHDHRDFLTKNILEDIYHCEFEHLLIHEKDLEHTSDHSVHTNEHHFCNHDHSAKADSPHAFIRKKP
ncbi:MAG: ATP-binding cassette domain-containing protein, partial [Bdellovibrionales bacterium]|nr:ATP-binding cassette domain-containing protein [Bdellovibrionales bacterium]